MTRPRRTVRTYTFVGPWDSPPSDDFRKLSRERHIPSRIKDFPLAISRIESGTAKPSPYRASRASAFATKASSPNVSIKLNGPPVNGPNPQPRIAPKSPSIGDVRTPSSKTQLAHNCRKRMVLLLQQSADPCSAENVS